MGKMLVSGESPLDRKVQALLARGVSWKEVTGYTLDRAPGQWPMLTVRIIADRLEDIEPLTEGSESDR